MDPKAITPLLLTALFVFAVYRRVRRNIGRQALIPTRLTWRIVLFGIVGTLMLIASLRAVDLFGAMAAGIVGGSVLAWFGLRHTQFEVTAEGRFYTPHTYIGVVVSALFLARILYRFVVLYVTPHAASSIDANPFGSYERSPLTLAIFGVLVGYYVAYYAGLLVRNRTLPIPERSPAE
jgi:hypothetical protein